MNSMKEMIEELLPNLIRNKKSLVQQFEQHPELKDFILSNQLSEEQILASLNQLHQYIDDQKHCAVCQDIKACPNLMNGHYTKLTYHFGQIQTTFVKCQKKKQKEDNDYKAKMFNSQYIPDEILKASFKNIDPTPGREDALTGLLEFCRNYKPGEMKKGIYLYGSLGVGKSHMMAAAAKKLADQKVDTLMVYVPDFFREIKQSIQDKSKNLNDKMDMLQKVQVLILDDIGAESISQWERDEILGAILQARMVKGLPTLYTSNLNYDDLEEHLAYSNKGGEEKLKAMRLMERIRHYTKPYFVDGPNRRIL